MRKKHNRREPSKNTATKEHREYDDSIIFRHHNKNPSSSVLFDNTVINSRIKTTPSIKFSSLFFKRYMSSTVLTQNIRKTESLILNQQTTTPDDSIIALWKSQIEQLQLALTAAAAGNKNQQTRYATVFDIEGTITPLFFVTKCLFPFFIDSCEAFVKKHITEKVFRAAISDDDHVTADADGFEKSMVEVSKEFLFHFFPDTKAGDEIVSNSKPKSLEEFQSLLVKDSIEHTRANRKIPYMKKLQGICWNQAYVDGSIVGDLFTDFLPFLEKFVQRKNDEKKSRDEVHIYSSGSIFAQKLLLGHSRFGDLTEKYIDGYHDTVSAGMKFEPASYQKIFDKIITGDIADDHNNKEDKLVCVFFSDSVLELRAAKKACSSLVTYIPVLTVRPQNPPLASSASTSTDDDSSIEFLSIFSFDQMTRALGLSASTEKEEDLVKTIEKELVQIRKDVEKYDVKENEERKIF